MNEDSSLYNFIGNETIYYYEFLKRFVPIYSFIMEKDNSQPKNTTCTKDQYTACMLLAAVGDAIGYKNGSWEFNFSSKLIHQDMMNITGGKGPLHLKIGLDWRYSDDTVMHLATAQGLAQSKLIDDLEVIAKRVAKEYKKCSKLMSGRAPGKTCMKTLSIINQDVSNWNKIPYSQLKGGGCGAAMRAACVGLFYREDVKKLIAIAIETGRITHHNPVGYLGAVVAAYFTHLGLKGITPEQWIARLFEEALPLAREYIELAGRQVDLNLKSGQWEKFEQSWKKYAKQRQLSLDSSKIVPAKFPQVYGIVERQHFYRTLAWTKWPGALGVDSTLIAYDAILSCKGSWEEFCLRGILHGGDNDSTGTIGGAWFGALYGYKGVPKNHYQEVEDNKKLRYLAQKLFQLAK